MDPSAIAGDSSAECTPDANSIEDAPAAVITESAPADLAKDSTAAAAAINNVRVLLMPTSHLSGFAFFQLGRVPGAPAGRVDSEDEHKSFG